MTQPTNSTASISIWRICVMKMTARTSKRAPEGEAYKFDCAIIDSKWYLTWCINEVLPAIKKHTSWLRSMQVALQQDGASPPHGQRESRDSQLSGDEAGVVVVCKPSHAAYSVT